MDKLVVGLRKEMKQSHFSHSYSFEYFQHFTFRMTIHCTSIKNDDGKHYFKCPNLRMNDLKL